MFRAMNKLKSDKRGFTLVELLVTMTIMVIALTLTVQLLGILWQNYRLVEYRWILQTAVEYVAGCFTRDANNEAIETADMANLYRDSIPNITSGTASFNLPSVPELGTLTYDADNKTLKVDPTNVSDELKEVLKQKCIYFLTVNDHFYIVRYDELMSWTYNETTKETTFTYNAVTKNTITDTLHLVEKDKADIKINIDFSVAGNVLPYDSANASESKPDAEAGIAYTKYIPTAINAKITGTIQEINQPLVSNKTEFNASIDMLNMNNVGKVNYDGKRLSSVYVAGWDKGTTLENYPSPAQTSAGATVHNPTSTANIVKYHSVNTPMTFSDTVTNKSWKINVKMPICLFFGASIGVDNQQGILQPIRDFRDNYLRGNAVGEKVIDVYYNAVSPAAVKLMHDIPLARAVLQEVTVGVSSALSLIE